MNQERRDAEYVPASIRAVAKQIGRTQTVDCRLRFEPFGGVRVGHHDQGRFRYLDAEAYLSHRFYADLRPTLWFEKGDTKYVLTNGVRFRDDEWELADEFPEAATLGDHGWVLGREAPDGDGFVPVGVNVSVEM